MKFGPRSLADAEGSILAHSVSAGGKVFKKGTVLSASEIKALKDAGLTGVTAATLDATDVGEDSAAAEIADALVTDGLRLGPVFTGRVNLIAQMAGVVRIDRAAIDAMNAIDEGLTLATLPDFQRVEADQLVGTVKIIPYGLPVDVVNAGVATFSTPPIVLHPFQGGKCRLIMTETPGFKPSLLTKGESIVRTRVEALGYSLDAVDVVPHDTKSVANALAGSADLTLILGASATSDRSDVAPAAVVAAGGRIDRFGMPVDPGNLLFLGDLSDNPVVGLPGCARSPALNGVDWVLERLSARLPVTGADIAAMGVGGLLKEMPGRPQPRRPKP